MNLLKTKRPEIFAYSLFCLAVWVYLWLRAALTPMTHDELATFFYYVHTGNFFPFSAHWDANNHFLNSALTFFSFSFFGPSPLALRLANLLSAPLYFFFLWKTGKGIRQPLLRWIFLLTLLAAHNFLAFFALSRGYGMSMALMMAGLWFLVRVIRSKQNRDHFLSLLFFLLVALANLTLLNTWLIALIILLFIYQRNRPDEKKSRDSFTLAYLLLGLIPLFLSMLLLFIMKDKGNLYGGAPGDLWNTTVRSLLRLLTESDHPVYRYVLLFYLLVIAGSGGILLFRKKRFSAGSVLFLLMLLGNILLTVLQSVALGLHWPEDRMVLYLFPFFIGTLFFILDDLAAITKILPRDTKGYGGTRIGVFLIVLPFIFFPLHFLLNLNTSFVSIYKNDHLPERFYDHVAASAVPGQFPPTLGGDRMRHFCWSYLDFRHGGRMSQVTWEGFPSDPVDFMIANSTEAPGWRERYDSADFDPVSGRCLLKRKVMPEMERIAAFEGIRNRPYLREEYFVMAKFPAVGLHGKSLYFGFDLTVWSPERPFEAWVTVSAFDSSHREVKYGKIALDWLRSSWDGEKSNFVNGLLVGEIPYTADSIVCHLWNIKKAPCRISNGRVLLHSVQ